MQMILFIVILASFILYPWVGKFYSWILKPLVANSFGAVFVGTMLIFSLIAIFNIIMGKSRLNTSGFSRKRNK